MGIFHTENICIIKFTFKVSNLVRLTSLLTHEDVQWNLATSSSSGFTIVFQSVMIKRTFLLHMYRSKIFCMDKIHTDGQTNAGSREQRLELWFLLKARLLLQQTELWPICIVQTRLSATVGAFLLFSSRRRVASVRRDNLAQGGLPFCSSRYTLLLPPFGSFSVYVRLC